MSTPWLSKLKGLDAYPKTIDEFKVRTLQGGLAGASAVSLLAFLCISLLLVSEVGYYFATDTVDKMVVDGGRNSMVSINFDVEFPRPNTWMLMMLLQCQEDEIEKVLRGEVNEGCRIKGSLVVSKVSDLHYPPIPQSWPGSFFAD
ncbi:hypothetical protein BBJ28_00013073 [Nothophytophthora sp. Chile5]|nr:hypothetical protein BBJ28_00013073 [Nothophytophthora sp. Chile5]